MNLQEIRGKVVLLKVCYDIPSLSDTARILDSLQTIKGLLANSNKIVILTHWGRPNGYAPDLSTKRLLPILNRLLPNNTTAYINQYDYEARVTDLADVIHKENHDVILFENTRFNSFEQSKNKQKRAELAHLYEAIADVYVDEAFALSHRSEVTNTELKHLLPQCNGLSYERELAHLNKLKKPVQPFVVIIGGAKLETKLSLLSSMLSKADKVILSGLISIPFLECQFEAGTIIKRFWSQDQISKESVKIAHHMLQTNEHKIILPQDGIMNPLGEMSDVGERSIELFLKECALAQTVFWNGPFGKYEIEEYARGTQAFGESLATKHNIYRVVGGGDTVACLPTKVQRQFNFVSMGGGATLDYLSK